MVCHYRNAAVSSCRSSLLGVGASSALLTLLLPQSCVGLGVFGRKKSSSNGNRLSEKLMHKEYDSDCSMILSAEEKENHGFELVGREFDHRGQTRPTMNLIDVYRQSHAVWDEPTDAERQFSEAIATLNSKSLQYFGAADTISRKQTQFLALDVVKMAQRELQHLHSPSIVPDKQLFEVLRSFIQHVHDAISTVTNETPGADDLLPVLIFLVVKSKPRKMFTALERLFKLGPDKCGEESYNRSQLYGAVQHLVNLINEEELHHEMTEIALLRPVATYGERDSDISVPDLADLQDNNTFERTVTVTDPGYARFHDQAYDTPLRRARGCGRTRAPSSCMHGFWTMMGRGNAHY